MCSLATTAAARFQSEDPFHQMGHSQVQNRQVLAAWKTAQGETPVVPTSD